MISEDYGVIMRSYAVVIFDVNNLKVINDNYGHETGDALLLAASSYICRTFSHSPVFRIGGDEFCTIVEQAKEDEILKSLSKFKKRQKQKRDKKLPVKLSVACGYAFYDEKTDADIEETRKRADVHLYNDKKKMKSKSSSGRPRVSFPKKRNTGVS